MHMLFFGSCSFWATYAILKGDSSILFINTVGLILQVMYIVLYYYFTENKVRTYTHPPTTLPHTPSHRRR